VASQGVTKWPGGNYLGAEEVMSEGGPFRKEEVQTFKRPFRRGGESVLIENMNYAKKGQVKTDEKPRSRNKEGKRGVFRVRSGN